MTETAELEARIRSRRWGWRAAFEAWHLQHGAYPSIATYPDGTRIVERDAPEFIKTNLANLAALGLQDIVQADGTLRLDSAGEYRYEPIGDLDHGFTAYERVPT